MPCTDGFALVRRPAERLCPISILQQPENLLDSQRLIVDSPELEDNWAIRNICNYSAMKKISLQRLFATVSAQVEQLASHLQELHEVIQPFRDQVQKKSRNRRKPPSSDGMKNPRTTSLRKSGQHPTGGQPGHSGQTLCQVEYPDRVAAEEITELTSSGVAVAERAGETLTTLVPNIQRTAELVQEISAASSEQHSGAEQINRAIQQLDQIIQQNAANSEEMAATAEKLESQAGQLQHTIAFFKMDKRGGMTGAEKRGREQIHRTTRAHDRQADEVIGLRPGNNGGDELDAEFERY